MAKGSSTNKVGQEGRQEVGPEGAGSMGVQAAGVVQDIQQWGQVVEGTGGRGKAI